MDRTKEIVALGYTQLHQDAVAAIGAMRWLSGLADPLIEACPMGLSPGAARMLADLLAEYEPDPTAWAGYLSALEGVCFGA